VVRNHSQLEAAGRALTGTITGEFGLDALEQALYTRQTELLSSRAP